MGRSLLTPLTARTPLLDRGGTAPHPTLPPNCVNGSQVRYQACFPRWQRNKRERKVGRWHLVPLGGSEEQGQSPSPS